ncbi:hypothetical protein EV421DRAFT_1906640 [Armillaria borealis]|uniref:Uncharacterized protein n=1 Tax=Armillaria borealis TaxID=47425 RepID=A0AA39J920_9AGAR|nr:hypothetical protein EV421DRAFT_1906640 [Armillaria borealis]
MTDQSSSKHMNNGADDAVLAAIFSVLQLTPAQHERMVQIVSHIQPSLAPQPTVAPLPSSITPADLEVWRRSQEARSATPPGMPSLVPDPSTPLVHAPTPTPTPALVVVPSAAPAAQPAPTGLIPFGPLPDNATVVPDGFNYHIPHARERGPYYLVAQGLDIGIYAGWEATAALVIGVSSSVYCKVPSVYVSCLRLDAGIAGGGVAFLP